MKRRQDPRGFSPQVSTDMRGQAENPFSEVSLGRGPRRSVLVFEGEIRTTSTSPRLGCSTLTTASTCSTNSTLHPGGTSKETATTLPSFIPSALTESPSETNFSPWTWQLCWAGTFCQEAAIATASPPSRIPKPNLTIKSDYFFLLSSGGYLLGSPGIIIQPCSVLFPARIISNWVRVGGPGHCQWRVKRW